ncbi:hypothetical protein N7516_002028 [Penicillium verrucosum]|uniref:uncharacterized protein n=1 Tax=Penicillium verrucosum TaxID=60171 RepID=UPI0025456107|nr:uncharacterized protein N7516_002028 [Penicillium verrucosum]KAJ5941860.1 hypothetical protein N7516_002028 [Penicillium verrucosum]
MLYTPYIIVAPLLAYEDEQRLSLSTELHIAGTASLGLSMRPRDGDQLVLFRSRVELDGSTQKGGQRVCTKTCIMTDP